MESSSKTGVAKSTKKSEDSTTKKTFCTSCRRDRPEAGGKWKVTNQGWNRFTCGDCTAIIKSRMPKTAGKAGRKPDPRGDISDYQVGTDEVEDREFLRQIGF